MTEERAQDYSAIMVHVDLAAATSRRVELARLLADRFGARLVGIAAEEPFTQYDAGSLVFVSSSVAEEERLRVCMELAKAEEAFRASAGSGENVDWRAAEASATKHLLMHSRAADLVLVGRQSDEDETDWRLGVSPGDIVMGLGRPMLLVPPQVRDLEAQRIIIAWKDTREARRAVIDALPFLRRARDVFIATVGGGSHGAEDVASYLQQRGVVSARSLHVMRSASVFTHLLEIADSEGADLIVAGAYGHSRIREWALGGVTQEILETSPACCLLSH
jgi:nucleotide-binding universal stress UspA family protein